MDKYYMLVRRFVNASFRLLNQVKWREEICTEYNGILTGRDGPLTYVSSHQQPSRPLNLCSGQIIRAHPPV
jgi:hypothetical protein